MGSKRYDDYCREAEIEYLESEQYETDFWEAVDADKKKEPTTWNCCGGINLYRNEKCSICGEGYDD